MLIVDAFNVLHTTGVLPPELADPGVPGLIRLIARSRYASRDLTVVCDGGTGAADSGVRLDHAFVIYSGTNREADDVIEELIDRYHRGNPLEVVSSDARLRRAARRRRAGSIPSERFLHHLVEDGRAPTRARGHALRAQVPLDRYSIEAWLTEFGVPHPPAESQRPTAPSRVVPNPTPTARPRPTKPKRPGRKPPSPSLGTRLDLPMPNRGSEPPPLPDPSRWPLVLTGTVLIVILVLLGLNIWIW